jgi:RNA 2',3'-cyclic 3'-phosphodiesterase
MRLFLALWPSERVRGALAEVGASLARRAAGKPVPAAKIHLTLAFLGEVAPDRLDAVLEAAAQARPPRFDLILDGVGSFRAARVAWAGCGQMPADLARLHAALDGGLRARGFSLDERRFAAHVTLVRKIARDVPPAPMPPIRWRATQYVLVRSDTGLGRYSVLKAWPPDGD